MVEIGKPISKELKTLFHSVITISDVIDLAAKNEKLSQSMFKHLFYRQAVVTDNNLQAIMDMVLKCNKVIEDSKTYFTKAETKLSEVQKIINTIANQ